MGEYSLFNAGDLASPTTPEVLPVMGFMIMAFLIKPRSIRGMYKTGGKDPSAPRCEKGAPKHPLPSGEGQASPLRWHQGQLLPGTSRTCGSYQRGLDTFLSGFYCTIGADQHLSCVSALRLPSPALGYAVGAVSRGKS